MKRFKCEKSIEALALCGLYLNKDLAPFPQFVQQTYTFYRLLEDCLQPPQYEHYLQQISNLQLQIKKLELAIEDEQREVQGNKGNIAQLSVLLRREKQKYLLLRANRPKNKHEIMAPALHRLSTHAQKLLQQGKQQSRGKVTCECPLVPCKLDGD